MTRHIERDANPLARPRIVVLLDGVCTRESSESSPGLQSSSAPNGLSGLVPGELVIDQPLALLYKANTSGVLKQVPAVNDAPTWTGAHIFQNRLTTTDGVVSGTARVVGGLASVAVAASTAITGATETRAVFDDTYTLPANSLKAGTVVKIKAAVFYTATTGSETHTLAVAFGSTNLAVTGNIDPASNDFSIIEFEVVCRDAGATGHVVGAGTCRNGSRAAALTSTHGLFTGTSTTSTQVIDTTAAIVIGLAIDRQAAATDSDSVRLDILDVEIIG